MTTRTTSVLTQNCEWKCYDHGGMGLVYIPQRKCSKSKKRKMLTIHTGEEGAMEALRHTFEENREAYENPRNGG